MTLTTSKSKVTFNGSTFKVSASDGSTTIPSTYKLKQAVWTIYEENGTTVFEGPTTLIHDLTATPPVDATKYTNIKEFVLGNTYKVKVVYECTDDSVTDGTSDLTTITMGVVFTVNKPTITKKGMPNYIVFDPDSAYGVISPNLPEYDTLRYVPNDNLTNITTTISSAFGGSSVLSSVVELITYSTHEIYFAADRLYICINSSSYYYTDDGTTWQSVILGLSNPPTPYPMPTEYTVSPNVYLRITGNTVERTTDNKLTWKKIIDFSTVSSDLGGKIHLVIIDNGTKLVINSQSGYVIYHMPSIT